MDWNNILICVYNFHLGTKFSIFNETCCKLNGVTDNCMGNCKDVDHHSLQPSNIYRMKSFCDKFEDTIQSCMLVWKPGMSDAMQYKRLSSTCIYNIKNI